MQSAFKKALEVSPGNPVDRATFGRDFKPEEASRVLLHHEPVVVSLSADSNDYSQCLWSDLKGLKKALGGETVPVTYSAQTTKAPALNMNFSEFLEIIASDEYPHSVRRLYLEQKRVPGHLLGHFTEFHKILSIFDLEFHPEALDSRTRFILFFAGRYSLTECHEHGGYEALLCQLLGEKEVLLHPPTKNNYAALYADPDRFENWSPVHPCDPDLEKFPNYADITCRYARVATGDVLYIPDGWYHSVASIGDETSVGFTYFFPQKYLDFEAEPRRVHTEKMLNDLSFSGKRRLLQKIKSNPPTVNSLRRVRGR